MTWFLCCPVVSYSQNTKDEGYLETNADAHIGLVFFKLKMSTTGLTTTTVLTAVFQVDLGEPVPC